MSWQASSFLLLALALAAGFAWYEREKPPARVVAMVAALAALAVAGRLVFAAIPNVKPTTDIVLFAGYALGAVPGFAVGAITAIVSNVFLSQGPWTVWQMAGWGAVGVAGAGVARMLRGREPNRWLLAAICGVAGLAFGAWMDVYQWTLGARQDLDSYLVVAASSLPYNLAHAIGNVAFCLLIGPAFIRALTRYRRRFEVDWTRPARAGTAVASALLLCLLLAGSAAAASPAERAERYLARAQNPDGGFGAAAGQASSPLYSGWTGVGLAAAGRNAFDVHRRGGRSLGSYVRRGLRGVKDIGEVERGALVLSSAGADPRRVGGRDLIAEIEARRRGDGSIAGFVSYTAFGVLAMRAAGEPAGRSTVRWLLRAQNADGGFGVAPSSASDSDMTGAVLQALATVGRSQSPVASRAVAYLLSTQGGDGGFGQMRGRSANAQSTSYAVQGLVAVGAARGAVARALRYLTRLQRRDGSIAYSSSSAQTPVWVTAQALAALKRAPLPVAAVPRANRKPRRSKASVSAAAAAEEAEEERSADAGESGGSDTPKDSTEARVEDEAAAPPPAGSDHSSVAGATLDVAGERPVAASGAVRSTDDRGGVRTWLVVLAVALALGAAYVLRRRLWRATVYLV